jgi:hypothetical protein
VKLIGINGFKESGKDTAYKLIAALAEHHGKTAVRRAFADNLKIAAAKALGYEGEPQHLIDAMNALKAEGGFVASGFKVLGAWDRSGVEKLTITGRKYLQLFGQKHREVFGDTFWIDQVLPDPGIKKYDLALPDLPSNVGQSEIDRALVEKFGINCDYAVVTDVRYENEAERVLDLGGVVLEIKRPGVESDGHDSERPLPPELVTHTIVNDGAIDAFKTKIEAFLGSLV